MQAITRFSIQKYSKNEEPAWLKAANQADSCMEATGLEPMTFWL